MSRADELRAQLELAEAEEAFAAAKADPKVKADKLRDLKLALREKRAAHRQNREG